MLMTLHIDRRFAILTVTENRGRHDSSHDISNRCSRMLKPPHDYISVDVRPNIQTAEHILRSVQHLNTCSWSSRSSSHANISYSSIYLSGTLSAHEKTRDEIDISQFPLHEFCYHVVKKGAWHVLTRHTFRYQNYQFLGLLFAFANFPLRSPSKLLVYSPRVCIANSRDITVGLVPDHQCSTSIRFLHESRLDVS